ncbi:MAG TPA: glycosyltransferase family 2 protein [Aliidongia sp.]|uniref:glycosyltransferase family 2 protein n=1 Tax=Aliidongia sp. TaxID=1914230 RepID=UPI002DDD6DC7|nr:glycosyltransferase family 2 protein [Aliidongia sp.]HEV2674610.1 glycosyltransferase family 2 protein [Aliidongia sp.]
MTLPTISVITVCRNAQECLPRAIESVLASDYPNLEYVVVDGGSTDGTLDVIERYSASIDRFVSERDDGISDAMNKGIALSTGEFHYLLHADDRLMPGALELLARAATPDGQVVCGQVRVMDGDKLFRLFRPEPLKLREKMSVPHMGCIVRKGAWEAVGGYDVARRIAMDHLFFLKIFKQFGASAFSTIDTVVADYSLGGLSDRRMFDGFREVKKNLIDMGFGKIWANFSYGKLVTKAVIRAALRAWS